MLAQTNYIQNSHRLSDRLIDESVGEVQPGQLFQLNEQGKWVYADGTKMAYPTLNARYDGAGWGMQQERLEGRDNVSRSGKIACLTRGFEIGTDQYDKDATYEFGMALVPAEGGLVAPAPADANASLIRGYVTHVPEDDSDFLRYEG